VINLLLNWTNFTSTKCINNDYLFNAVLGLAAVIQNMVAFLKLISFTNAAICNDRILKSKRMIYECGYLNSRILKSKRMIYECGSLNSRIRKPKRMI